MLLIMTYLSTPVLLIACWAACLPALPARSSNVQLSHAPAGRLASGAGEAGAAAQRAGEITEANWQQHPKIREVRRLVNSVDAGLKKGVFKTSKREFESCGDQYYTLRRIAHDSKGAAVWYEEYYEGEDRSYGYFHYYDSSGQLRFVFASARAANGTRAEHRIYFDETGERIWEDDRLLKGPGCPGCFPDPYPAEALAFDPAKTFAEDEDCVEITSKPTRRRRR